MKTNGHRVRNKVSDKHIIKVTNHTDTVVNDRGKAPR